MIDRSLISDNIAMTVQKETSYAGGGDIIDATPLQALDGSAIETQTRAKLDNPESRPDRGKNMPFLGKLMPAPVKIPHLIPLDTSDDVATAVMTDTLMEAVFGGDEYNTPSGLQCQATSTAAKLVMAADTHGLKVGDLIRVNGDEACVVKAAAGSVDVYVDPPLSAAPSATDPVDVLKQFPFSDIQPTLCIHSLEDLEAKKATGFVVDEFTLETVGKEITKLGFNGPAAYVTQIMATKLAEAVASSGSGTASFKVDDKENLAVGMYISIGDEKGMKITALDTATGQVTATRPATYEAHSLGDEVLPYWPTITPKDVVAQGKSSWLLFYDGTTREVVDFEKFSLSVKNAADQVNDEGNSDGPTDTEHGNREITLSAVCRYRRKNFDRVRKMEEGTEVSILHVSATPDKSHGIVIYFPRCIVEVAPDTSGKTKKMNMTFTVAAMRDLDGKDVLNMEMRAARF